MAIPVFVEALDIRVRRKRQTEPVNLKQPMRVDDPASVGMR